MVALLALLFWAQPIDIQSADAAYNAGRYAEAAAQYRQFLKQMPNEPALYLRLGAAEYALGEFESAERSFRKALELRPGLPPAQVGLGTALLTLGRAEEAVGILKKAVEAMPRDPQARRALGHAYVETGEFISGEEILRSLVEESPKDWESWYYLGVLLVNQNYSEPALEALERSLELYPDNPRALIYRAGALTQLGRLEEAEAEFAKLARNRKINESSEYYLGYTQLLFMKQRYEEALGMIDKAIERDPKSGKLRFWKARTLLYMGRKQEAAKVAETCVELSPNMPGGRNLLLRIYRQLGETEKAAEQVKWLKAYEDKVALGRGR